MKAVLQKPYRGFMNMKLFHKFILIYVLVILLPTSILEMSLYRQSAKSVRDQYTLNESNALEGAGRNLYTQISNIRAAVGFMGSSNTLIQYLNGFYYTETEELYYYIRDIQPLLQYVSRADPAILDIDFYGFTDYHLNWTGRLHAASELVLPGDMPSDARSLTQGVWYKSPGETERIRYYQYLYDANYTAAVAVLVLEISLERLMENYSSLGGTLYLGFDSDPFLFQFANKESGAGEVLMTKLSADTLHGTPVLKSVPSGGLGLTLFLSPDPLPSLYNSNRVMVFSLLLLLFISTGLYLWIVTSISGRISLLQKHISESKADNLVPLAQTEFTDEIGHLTTSYNHMIDRINDLLVRIYSTEFQKRDAEFYALQAQIEPHFLYNILENIHMSAEVAGDSKTAAMVTSLGKFMRYNLNTDTGFVSLTDELTHARNYLDIHKIRMQDKLSVTISVFTDIEDIECPRFILQPLLENSLKHAPAGGEPLSIELTVRDREAEVLDGDVILRIKDNGRGMSEEELCQLKESLKNTALPRDQHIGLNSINSRLQAFYGREYALQVDSAPGSGFAVTMFLKRIGPDKNENHDR